MSARSKVLWQICWHNIPCFKFRGTNSARAPNITGFGLSYIKISNKNGHSSHKGTKSTDKRWSRSKNSSWHETNFSVKIKSKKRTISKGQNHSGISRHICLTGEYIVHVDPIIPLVVHTSRRIPISPKEKFKTELDSLVNQGIISLVIEQTPWIDSFVCVTKANGSVLLCLDPRDLNKAVLRSHFVTPSFEDITSQLHDARWYTMVDIKSGYWHLNLDKKSRKLTTFIIPFGRYIFNSFPIGIKSA